MFTLFKRFIREEDGQDFSEYALILGAISGGNDDGGEQGDGGSNNNGGVCTPGNHMTYRITAFDESSSTCTAFPIRVDNCSGAILQVWEQPATIACSLQESPAIPEDPCTTFSVSAGGITCTNSGWNISARVTFPEI